MVLLIVAVLLAVAIGLFLTPGVGLLGLIPLALVVAFGAWLVVALVTGRSPGTQVRRTKRQALLGPGGPDDPDA